MLFVFTTWTACLASTLIFGRCNGYWRLPCSLSLTSRIDPVVTPGKISSHAHKFSGGSNIYVNSTYDSLRQSTCTTCQVTADKSAYWTPQLYYHHNNGSFEEVPNSETVVYYLGRGEDRANSVAFPPGFRMVSGDMMARSYDNTSFTFSPNSTWPGRPIADRVSFNCLDSEPLAEQPYMWRTDCAAGLRAQIQFQSCWDGNNLYLADNSHVAYMSQIDNGLCPPTHPVQLVHLFYEVLYGVNQIQKSHEGEFVFAMGDPTGYGFHGDFLNGWDMDVLEAATTECANTDDFGEISACNAFQPYDLGYTNSWNCPEQAPVVNETYHGMIGTALPGCNPIQPGPEPATFESCPTATVPTLYTPPSQTPTEILLPSPGQMVGKRGWIYEGCYDESVNGTSTINGLSFSGMNQTIEACQSFCGNEGYPLAGLHRGVDCWCGIKILSSASTYTRACFWECPGNASEICGDLVKISIYRNTLRSKVSPPGAGPTPNAGVYAGCGSDLNISRGLTGASVTTTNMSLEFCREYCDQRGFFLSGAEYSDECYCGNTLGGGNVLLTSNDTCNSICAGNRNETCGGSKRLSIFNSTNLTPPSSPVFPVIDDSATTTSGSIATLTPQSMAAGIYLGCATDSSVSGRTLQGSAYSDPAMTLEACRAFCDLLGYYYSGAEYAQECYCGTKLSNRRKILTSDDSCQMNCAGNALEICGGSDRLSLFGSRKLTNGPTGAAGRFTHCYTDPNNGTGRALTGSSFVSSNLTLEACRQFCDARKYTLSGVEFGQECYCGPEISTVSGAKITKSRYCNMTCGGNKGEMCGGRWRLAVFSRRRKASSHSI